MSILNDNVEDQINADEVNANEVNATTVNSTTVNATTVNSENVCVTDTVSTDFIDHKNFGIPVTVKTNLNMGAIDDSTTARMRVLSAGESLVHIGSNFDDVGLDPFNLLVLSRNTTSPIVSAFGITSTTPFINFGGGTDFVFNLGSGPSVGTPGVTTPFFTSISETSRILTSNRRWRFATGVDTPLLNFTGVQSTDNTQTNLLVLSSGTSGEVRLRTVASLETTTGWTNFNFRQNGTLIGTVGVNATKFGTTVTVHVRQNASTASSPGSSDFITSDETLPSIYRPITLLARTPAWVLRNNQQEIGTFEVGTDGKLRYSRGVNNTFQNQSNNGFFRVSFSYIVQS